MAEDNNQSAPASSDNVETAVNQTPSASDTANDVKTESNTANNTTPAVPEFDPRTSFESLKSQYDNINKSYSELRKEFTRRSQAESALQKQMDSLVKSFSEATKKEISPEEFMQSLQSQGIKALDPIKESWIKPVQEEYTKALAERDSSISMLETRLEFMTREMDNVNYPDFAKLKNVMNDIANSENCPVDFSRPAGECLDALYKLAKESSAEKAVIEAQKLGQKKAEASLAKEAKTAVAGGGKAASSTAVDVSKITDVNKMRELLAQTYGVADRD